MRVAIVRVPDQHKGARELWSTVLYVLSLEINFACKLF